MRLIVQNEQNNQLCNLLREIQGFLQMNSTIIDQHPLQLYSSLIFSIPSGSQLDRTCPTRLPPWLLHAPEPIKASDQARYILEGEQDSSEYFSFSSDNSLLGTSDSNGANIRIWSLQTGECVHTININGGIYEKCFRLSHDGMWVATTSLRYPDVRSSGLETESVNDDEISDTNSQEEDNDIMSDEEEYGARSQERGYGISGREEDDDIMNDEENSDTRNQEEEAYTRSDKSAYDASSNSQCYPRLFLKVWHVGTGELMRSLAVEYDRQPFQFSPDSRLLVSISDTGCAIVLALDTAESATENCLAGSEQIIRPALLCNCYNHGFDYNDAFDKYPPHFSMEFSPDSSPLTIMSPCTDEYAVWETKTFQCIQCQSITPFFRTSFELSSRYRQTISVALTNNASIMMAGTIPMERDRALHPRTVFEIRWINSAEVISTLNCQEPIKSSKFSLDQTTLATITESGSIQTWRVETGECLTLFESDQDWRDLFLSPDFTLLAWTGLTRTISVWANGARAKDQSSRKVSDPIMSVVLSLNRTLAASSSYYGVVRVWNMDTYGCTHQFNDEDQMQISDALPLQLFQFTKDGKCMFVSRTPPPPPNGLVCLIICS